MKRIRVVAGRTVLVTAVTAVVLSGCSALSPATISTPYPPADGVGLTLPGTGVLLRNFLVVGTAKDAPAAVIGTVVNDGSSPVEVSLQVPLGTATGAAPATAGQAAQGLFTVAAHGTVMIGPDQTAKMVISDLAVEPGATTTLTAATQVGGRAEVELPVTPPQGIYASLTPAPTPSATPTPTTTASATSAAGKAATKKKKKSATSTTATDSATATAAPTATATTN